MAQGHLHLLELLRQNEILGHLTISTLQTVETCESIMDTERRRWGVRPVNRKRNIFGHFCHFYRELRHFDDELFFKFYRMSYEEFSFILSKIGPSLQKFSHRESISPEQRLVICLRYLASGDSISTLHAMFRIGESTARKIIKEVCKALQAILGPSFLKTPQRESEWRNIAKDFQSKTKFPNVIRCIDGKHIEIFAPPNSGTKFWNYKRTYSIVLLAVCDANYSFIYTHAGSFGSESDGGIFQSCSLSKALETNSLNLPSPKPINEAFNRAVPHVLLGDEAFPKKKYLMTPYSGRYLENDKYLYNLEFSRCRRLIENTFGIYTTRWRIFHHKIHCFPEHVDEIVGATLILHNYLSSVSRQYLGLGSRDWQDEDHLTRWEPLPERFSFGARNAIEEASLIRDYIKDYIAHIN
ncbi:uncharacterized protein LOC129809407 isoform X1 [Phlebotomus papatasi]|uniref:uncharacterized protein LOC129809407 isoform X1 n=1 Tax=Phlebotomus papatasi TaxID=29031 RepID=UPI0024846F4A|nr:uncharacterized protein LOC129809407 isoform X1 [Phlebotomus papatasi]